MATFYEDPNALIVPEMLRQGIIPDSHEALRIIGLDESETSKDKAISLCVAALGITSAAGILAGAGLVMPILVPLAVLGLAGINAWNSQVTQRERQSEADFLSDHPEILRLAEAKVDEGHPLPRVAAAVETAYRAYILGDTPQLAIDSKPTNAPAIAPGVPAVGAATQLGAIPVPAVAVAEVEPQTYPMAQTAVSPDDRRALIARLREECPALLKLVKSHPIRAVGVQRSGKTTLVKRLALLRMVLIPGHRVIAATPHAEAANPYPAKAFKTVGITTAGKRDYQAIEREWDGLAARVASCQESSITTIWDEFGLFDQVMAEEKIKTNLTSCLRETMKFGEYPVFIVHGETAAFLPGSKGLVTVFLGSTVRVEAIGEAVEDEMGLKTIRPTGRFTVTWLDGSRDEGQVPGWLTEQYLLGLIGNSVPSSNGPSPAPEPEHQHREGKTQPAIAAPATVVSPPEPEQPTVPIEQQIADFIKAYPPGNGGAKLRDVKRKFRNEDPKKIEGICLTLARCYPAKFRVSSETVKGVESMRIEAIT